MKTLTMITRQGVSKDEISAYTLITSDYQTVTMAAPKLAEAIKSCKVKVTNMAITAKGLVSTNGALDKYTFINTATNQVEGVARAVILDRVEQGGKLVGYTVFAQNGVLAELSVSDAAALASKGAISNGKIRHTQEGDIVAAIGGTYPLREIAIEKAPKGEITIDILYFATACGTKANYFGAIVSCTSATEMSKITDALSKSNAKLTAEIVKVGGQGARESLGIKRMGTNSLYGVFEIRMLEKLIKADAKIHNALGTITVSAVKYDADGSVEESKLEITKDWKVAEVTSEKSEVANRAREYTKKIIETFEKVKITK